MICPNRGIPVAKDSLQVGGLCTTLSAKRRLTDLALPNETVQKPIGTSLIPSQKHTKPSNTANDRAPGYNEGVRGVDLAALPQCVAIIPTDDLLPWSAADHKTPSG